MFTSIRYKLFLYMIISVVLFAFLLYGANSLFAQKYYTYYKKTVLIESSQKISELLKGKDPSKEAITEDIQFEINRVERSIGGTAFLGTLAGQLYYPASRNDSPPRPGGNPFYILNNNANTSQIISRRDNGSVPAKKDVTSWERYTDKSFFVTLEDPSLKIESIRFQTELDNGLVLLVWVPIAQISESVAVSNRLTSIIAIVIIIITGIWAFFISRSFTRPITQMNFITKKMAKMDFTQTLNVSGKDEISQLSENINDLSDKLDRAIGELNSKNQQLELDIGHERKLDELRKVFISSVSHELKTPIFLIQGYAEGLKVNVVIDEEKRNFYCDVIIEEADKMDILVKDLLDLSQMESGMFSINKMEFDLVELTEDVVKKFEPLFTEMKVDLKMQLPKQAWVHADPIRIEQAVVNFLNNAVNHIDGKKQLAISIQQEAEKIRLRVYNSGPRIPEELVDKIWISFFKADQARTREYGGTGLGLSVVRVIQEAHQNKYSVTNLDEGVEFWLEVDGRSDHGKAIE